MLDAEARERVIVALDCDREEALSLAKQVSHTPKVILIENDIPHLFSH